MHAKEIIDRFGGQSALARRIGKGQSTVAYWAKTGIIPARWQAMLMGVAIKDGIKITAKDLLGAGNTVPDATEAPKRPALPMNMPVTELAAVDGERSPFMFYTSGNGSIKVQVLVEGESVWASQKGMGEIFGVEIPTINYHLKEIFESAELDELSVIRKFLITAFDGKKYETGFYNLDAIISVGYRVNSLQATQFRKWATTVLKSYLIKGFVLDDDRLKQSGQLFGKDYFDELLEKIREIRASERRFYQKITDLYAAYSVDYDPHSPITAQFYAHVQDKLHFAIHGHTSAELIELRADASKPHMGLTNWKNSGKGGKVTKLDVGVGKNYLTAEEIKELDLLVSMYLDSADNFARRHKLMKMEDWIARLDGFLDFNAYAVLKGHGKISRTTAERHVYAEYEKFRVIQDAEYKSDFDKVVEGAKVRRLPREAEQL